MDDAATQRGTGKTPSQRIIDAFGGIRAAARRFERPPSTVQHWYETAIPARHQQMFLTGAKEDGLNLTPADFFELPNVDDPEPGDVEPQKGAENSQGAAQGAGAS